MNGSVHNHEKTCMDLHVRLNCLAVFCASFPMDLMCRHEQRKAAIVRLPMDQRFRLGPGHMTKAGLKHVMQNNLRTNEWLLLSDKGLSEEEGASANEVLEEMKAWLPSE